MPVNYSALRPQIQENVRAYSASRQDREARLRLLTEQFIRFSARLDIRDILRERLANDSGFRCALPYAENMGTRLGEGDIIPQQVRILACDGSQITPSRHDEISFGVINTAVFDLVLNSGEVPKIHTVTDFLGVNSRETEEEISLLRDVAEKETLAQIGGEIQDAIPTFAVSDGTLELYKIQPTNEKRAEAEKRHAKALTDLRALNIPAVGYIDRPASASVARMMDLLCDSDGEFSASLCDRDLFEILLQAGERSAVFAMNGLDYCFFYLNVGSFGHPAVSRVEIPRAVADDGDTVRLLQQLLLNQCRILSDHPYPYALHRAHECAVISYAERDRIKSLILGAYRENGLIPTEKSNKQFAKDLMKK